MTRRSRPPTPAEEAQIRAVLALDVDLEDELIRERALEIAAECAGGDGARRVPELDAEAWRLQDAFEGVPPAHDPPVGPARTARAVARHCLELADRIAARR